MANEITFDKLPQALGYLTEKAERIHKNVAALQPQTATDKHRIVEIDEACKITRKGLIPAYKRGKKLYFYEDELLQWLSLGERHYRLSTSKSKQQKFSWREEQKC